MLRFSCTIVAPEIKLQIYGIYKQIRTTINYMQQSNNITRVPH